MGISKEKKKLLCAYVNYQCELCIKKNKIPLNKLEIHRIRPEYEGGDYSHRNCMVVCEKHHEILNSAQRMSLGVQS